MRRAARRTRSSPHSPDEHQHDGRGAGDQLRHDRRPRDERQRAVPSAGAQVAREQPERRGRERQQQRVVLHLAEQAGEARHRAEDRRCEPAASGRWGLDLADGEVNRNSTASMTKSRAREAHHEHALAPGHDERDRGHREVVERAAGSPRSAGTWCRRGRRA